MTSKAPGSETRSTTSSCADTWRLRFLTGQDLCATSTSKFRIHTLFPNPFGEEAKSILINFVSNLNPGGWAEFQDMSTDYYSQDGTYTEKNATWGWNKTFVRACESLGRDPCPGPKLEGWVRDHGGFQSVYHQRFRAPIGPWPKDPYYRDIGMLNLAQILEGLEAFSLKLFCGVLGRTREEVLVELAAVRKELKTGAFHSMFDL